MTEERDKPAAPHRASSPRPQTLRTEPFGSYPQKIMAIAAGAFVGLVGASIVRDALQSRTHRAAPPRPALVAPLPGGATDFEVSGADRSNRRATFRIVLPPADVAWTGALALTAGGKPIDARTTDAPLPPPVVARLAEARQIVVASAVAGSASRPADTHRAGLQAGLAAKLVAAAAPAATPLWSLNLGGYATPCAACNAEGARWPGAFLVILVTAHDANASLAEALADAMTARTNIPPPTAFTGFALTRVR